MVSVSCAFTAVATNSNTPRLAQYRIGYLTRNARLGLADYTISPQPFSQAPRQEQPDSSARLARNSDSASLSNCCRDEPVLIAKIPSRSKSCADMRIMQLFSLEGGGGGGGSPASGRRQGAGIFSILAIPSWISSWCSA